MCGPVAAAVSVIARSRLNAVVSTAGCKKLTTGQKVLAAAGRLSHKHTGRVMNYAGWRCPQGVGPGVGGG